MDTQSIDTNKVAHCTFELTGQPMSQLKCSNNESYEAFSGKTDFVNNPDEVGNAKNGPLPPGRYYILDREHGGMLGWIRDPIHDLFARTDRDDWFSLYRDDGSIDDSTIVNNVTRGSFRLHPAGPMRVSEGCVTLTSKLGFEQVSIFLRNMTGDLIPGTTKKYYGVLDVIDPRNAR
ncbi:hypothetical protein ALP50_200029 [Pseudomonas syringae pv. spinaceae]|nr:DUF2778 domain-containing protein [Pseudomonas syringae]RMT37182.1 hypothetical protein ALP50_200029 [Pseudomonas syringae pv. spinaceae]